MIDINNYNKAKHIEEKNKYDYSQLNMYLG